MEKIENSFELNTGGRLIGESAHFEMYFYLFFANINWERYGQMMIMMG